MNLKKPLRTIFAEGEIDTVITWYEVIGDIVIITLSPSFEHLENKIAQAVLKMFPDLRIIAKRISQHSGEFRVPSLVKIEGEGDFSTVHKEFGLRLHVDPETVYFSPRSASERYRIAEQVKPGEKVLVMFSGVGPFALMIGLHAEASEVIGVEKNPNAYRLALRNLDLNKKVQHVVFCHGDVEDILPNMKKQFDRIVMPLPLSGGKYLNLALSNLLPGGMLHFYDFQFKNEFELSLSAVRAACESTERKIIEASLHRCGHVGSRRFRVCVDAKIN